MNLRVCFYRFVVLTIGPVLIVLTTTWTLHWKAGIPMTMLGTGSTRNASTLTEMFTYSDEAVYKTVMEIRTRNCIGRYGTSESCVYLNDCENATSPKTICKKRLPKALIIGAYKSGTRELIDFLAMHPLVKIKRLPEYESSYFDKNLGFGADWYQRQMPTSLDTQLTIEKSPSYFASQVAPKEIYMLDQTMKLILMVREPVARTISHFSFDEFQALNKHGGSLGRCILQKQWLQHKRPDKMVNKNCFAVKHSLYSENLKNFLSYFKLSQIKIIDADAFAKDPCSVLSELERFLELKPLINCHDFLYNHVKKFFCVADPTGSMTGVCYGRNRGRVNNSDTPDSRHLEPILQRFYKPYNEEFFKMIGKRFNW